LGQFQHVDQRNRTRRPGHTVLGAAHAQRTRVAHGVQDSATRPTTAQRRGQHLQRSRVARPMARCRLDNNDAREKCGEGLTGARVRGRQRQRYSVDEDLAWHGSTSAVLRTGEWVSGNRLSARYIMAWRRSLPKQEGGDTSSSATRAATATCFSWGSGTATSGDLHGGMKEGGELQRWPARRDDDNAASSYQ
jgi:hypothetical protein